MKLLGVPVVLVQQEQSRGIMDLKIPYQNLTDKNAAYKLALDLIPQVIAKFGVKAEVEKDDADCLMKAKGSGFEAKIHFLEKEAQVSVSLGLLLKPFKSKILETIEHQIKKVV